VSRGGSSQALTGIASAPRVNESFAALPEPWNEPVADPLRIVRIAVEPPVQFAVFQNRAQD
jgi:hypothetical protein